MPARFRIFDTGGDADRYTVVDSKPYAPDFGRGPWRTYLGMNSCPFHPSYGIGQHGEFDFKDWAFHRHTRFRRLGKRIALDDLPSDARRAAEAFIAERKGDGKG